MDNLRKLRLEKGLAQKEVAIDIGVSISTYSRYESGKTKPDPETLRKLSEFFDVSVDYLVGIIDDPISPAESQFIDEYKKKSTKALLGEYTLHASGVPLTEEQQETLIELLKNSTIEEVEKMLKVFKAMQD